LEPAASEAEEITPTAPSLQIDVPLAKILKCDYKMSLMYKSISSGFNPSIKLVKQAEMWETTLGTSDDNF